jgi:hypothetical protein
MTGTVLLTKLVVGYLSLRYNMTVDYVILRPRRKDNVRQEFCIVLRKEIKTTQHRKLGLYDPKNGKIEEWCHKEDIDHFVELRLAELDQG